MIFEKQSYEAPRCRFFVLETEDFMGFNSDGNESTDPGGDVNFP